MTQYNRLGKHSLRLLALATLVFTLLVWLAPVNTTSVLAEGGSGSEQAAPGVEEMGLVTARWNAATKKVLVKWNSVNESQIVGYNVLKKDGNRGWPAINSKPINAKHPGMFFGATYKFKDAAVTPGKTVKYRIEWISANGSARVSEVSQVRIPGD